MISGNRVANVWQTCGKRRGRRVAIVTAAEGLSPTSGPGFSLGITSIPADELGIKVEIFPANKS